MTLLSQSNLPPLPLISTIKGAGLCEGEGYWGGVLGRGTVFHQYPRISMKAVGGLIALRGVTGGSPEGYKGNCSS